MKKMRKTVKDVSRVIISRKHLKKIQSVKLYDSIRTYKKCHDSDLMPLIAAVLYDIYCTSLQRKDNETEH